MILITVSLEADQETSGLFLFVHGSPCMSAHFAVTGVTHYKVKN